MTAEQRNYLNYAMLALAAFAVGCATALVPQLMDPTMPDLNWRIVLGTGITAVVTAAGGSLLPRSGSTGLAAEVDKRREEGYHRADLTVVPKPGAAPIISAADEVIAATGLNRDAPDREAVLAAIRAMDAAALTEVRLAALNRHHELATQQPAGEG